MVGLEILDIPFFTLEYDAKNACFLRRLPSGAQDIGNGKFQWQGKTLVMQENAETKILEKPTIKGKDMLALVRRGYNPLIKSGPIMADRNDRLMELGLAGGTPAKAAAAGKKNKKTQTGVLEMEIILRTVIGPEQWLPLEGLPNHRLYENRIYEIVPDEVLALFSKKGGKSATNHSGKTGNLPSLILRGDEIPEFADNYARLIYVFADEMLYKLIAQDEVFINPSDVSLVLCCRPVMERGVGKAKVFPALKYKNRRYSANALSWYFHRKYLHLKDRWIRRETLERTGIGPLGCFTNGESLAPFDLKAKDFFAGGGEALRNPSLAENSNGLEMDENHWVSHGKEQEIFSSHLEFLRQWGFSGGIIAEPEKAASFLADWLVNLSKALQEERVLVLMPKTFWDQRLCKELPQSGEGPMRVPADSWYGSDSVWAPSFRGIGLGFFDDPEAGSNVMRNQLFDIDNNIKKIRGKVWDIIVIVGLDSVSDEVYGIEETIRQIEALPCRLRLGVFFSSSGIFGNIHAARIKPLFNIKGPSLQYEKYLIRAAGEFLSLPAQLASSKTFQRPLRPIDDNYLIFGGGRFLVEAKFQNISVASYVQEQQEFYDLRKDECQFIPVEGTLNYKNLTEQEKNYFFYWRSEFRKGVARESSPAYILLYAAELILRMDVVFQKSTNGSITAQQSADKALNGLYRLWDCYWKLFPGVLINFPQWMFDFAVIHRAENISEILPELLTHTSASKDFHSVLFDTYLHRKYIEENHSPEWKDFVPLAGEKYSGTETSLNNLFMAAGDEALNNLDRALRKYYGKKLLEFFCPLPPVKQNFTCFDGLDELVHNDLGYSAYSAEWLSYSRHKPFIKFLDSLAAFLENRIRKTIDPENRSSAPYFDPVWKYLCGLGETVPPKLEDLIFYENGSNANYEPELRFEKEKIIRLREESEAVREMLKVENYEFDFEDDNQNNFLPRSTRSTTEKNENLILDTPHFSRQTVEKSFSDASSRARSAIIDFITSMDPLSLDFLKLLLQGKGQELETFARKNDTMAELIIDRINEQFLAEFGDLLIESDEDQLDQHPIIGEQYRDEVIWALTFQNA